jgi:hypothetical protein
MLSSIFILSLVVAAAAVGIAGLVWWIRAMDRLSDEGQAHVLRILFWSKLFSGRENFTDEGWSYLVRARSAFALSALLVLLLGFCRSGS